MLLTALALDMIVLLQIHQVDVEVGYSGGLATWGSQES